MDVAEKSFVFGSLDGGAAEKLTIGFRREMLPVVWLHRKKLVGRRKLRYLRRLGKAVVWTNQLTTVATVNKRSGPLPNPPTRGGSDYSLVRLNQWLGLPLFRRGQGGGFPMLFNREVGEAAAGIKGVGGTECLGGTSLQTTFTRATMIWHG